MHLKLALARPHEIAAPASLTRAGTNDA